MSAIKTMGSTLYSSASRNGVFIEIENGLPAFGSLFVVQHNRSYRDCASENLKTFTLGCEYERIDVSCCEGGGGGG